MATRSTAQCKKTGGETDERSGSENPEQARLSEFLSGAIHEAFLDEVQVSDPYNCAEEVALARAALVAKIKDGAGHDEMIQGATKIIRFVKDATTTAEQMTTTQARVFVVNVLSVVRDAIDRTETDKELRRSILSEVELGLRERFTEPGGKVTAQAVRD